MAATFNGTPKQQLSPATALPMLAKKTKFWRRSILPSSSIPKHNLLVIGGDMNAQIGKNRHNKYSLHYASNRNGQHLIDFMIENRLTCLNTNFQKREGKLWTYTYANKSKAQIDYVLINRKWKNSAMNLRVCPSDHRIVTANDIRKNATRKATTKHYDWALLW